MQDLKNSVEVKNKNYSYIIAAFIAIIIIAVAISTLNLSEEVREDWTYKQSPWIEDGRLFAVGKAKCSIFTSTFDCELTAMKDANSKVKITIGNQPKIILIVKGQMIESELYLLIEAK